MPRNKHVPRHKHVPQRTCVVCRSKTDKRQLTRVVKTDTAGVIIDPTGKQNGRGAYVCDNQACWDKIQHSHVLDQALRTSVSVAEKQALADYRAQQLQVSKP